VPLRKVPVLWPTFSAANLSDFNHLECAVLSLGFRLWETVGMAKDYTPKVGDLLTARERQP
jgi:hypothetical protein